MLVPLVLGYKCVCGIFCFMCGNKCMCIYMYVCGYIMYVQHGMWVHVGGMCRHVSIYMLLGVK